MLRRWIILLPLCMLLQDRLGRDEENASETDLPAIAVSTTSTLSKKEDLLCQDVAALSFASCQAFPASIPWVPLHEVGDKGVGWLIQYHPPLFLEMCLERYRQEVKSYSTKLIKHERVAGKMEAPERIEILFREQPFSVYMNWLEGGVGGIPPQKVLYVKGENNNKLLARGRKPIAYWAGVFEKEIHSDEVKKTGRYTIDDFGIYLGTKRSLESMRAAEARGKLTIRYEGEFRVPEVNDRICYKFVRTPYDPPEELEGLNEYTLFVDKENWLQVGSILKDVHGKMIASYYFSDLKINPPLKTVQFTKAGI